MSDKKEKEKNIREKVGRHITLMKKGRVYYAEICKDNRQRRQSLGTRNIKEARLKALELDAKLQRGESLEKPERTRLAEAVELYESHLESEGRRESTLRKYRFNLNCFLDYAEEHGLRFIDQISLLFVEKYKAAEKRNGKGDVTLRDRVTIVKQLTRWAVERDILARDPLASLKPKKGKSAPQPCFTTEQIEVIFNACDDQQRDICEVLAFSGMRIGELKWLAWDDVDFDKGFLRIRPKDDWVPKHNRSRVIPMHDRVRSVLEKQPKKYRWIFAAGKSGKNPKGGGQINPNHILERLKAVLKSLGISGHLHTFRHFFASHCANSGVPPFQLVKWLGHADVGMVMHYYELHDEESLWTMKKLSLADAKEAGQEQTDAKSEAG